jgi:hypothetical protein
MILGGFVLLSFAAVIPSAPPQAQPVFEILAPTIYPQCGTATLAVFEASTTAQGLPKAINDGLADAGLPGVVPNLPLGAAVFSAAAPVFAICGQTPRPATQLTCIFDQQAQQAVSAAAAQAGAALPLGLHPEGDAIEQAIVLEDRLPPPANSAALGSTAALVLGCAPITYTPPTRGDFSSAPTYTPPGSTYVPPSPLIPGAIPAPYTNPGTQVPPVLSQQPTPSTPVGDAVRYAAVWLLPLALLLFGGYFGGALTRDIELPASPA